MTIFIFYLSCIWIGVGTGLGVAHNFHEVGSAMLTGIAVGIAVVSWGLLNEREDDVQAV